jgi:hypothetical protein
MNNHFSTLCESCLAIGTTDDIFRGGFCESRWRSVSVERQTGRAGLRSNMDVIQTDVRLLAINFSGHIFAGT